MKVKDLIEEIDRYKKEYREDFLNWDIYTEQISESDKKYKKEKQGWKCQTDSEDWEYFDCAGFWARYKEKRILTINVNY